MMTNPVSHPVVVVRGHATVEVAPDYCVVNVYAERESTVSQAEALRQANDAVAALRAALEPESGIRSITVSRVRVHGIKVWNDTRKVHEHAGWSGELAGVIKVDTGSVGRIAAVIAAAGSTVAWLDWRVEDTNPAYREVRKDAVAKARIAAEDFADAVNRELGELQVLADPGLSAAGAAVAQDRSAKMRGMAAPAGAPFGSSPNDEVDLDPAPIMLSAGVEATYLLV